jgi:hypothetical protein
MAISINMTTTAKMIAEPTIITHQSCEMSFADRLLGESVD